MQLLTPYEKDHKMCVSPSIVFLPDGRSQEVGCRSCRICRDNETKDWVGRCLAESRTNPQAFSVTLTYAPIDAVTGEVFDKNKHMQVNKVDVHERAAVLFYSDIQKYFKRLRRRGYALRFLIAGEIGKRKGRTHWHGVFFFKDKVPPHKLYEMFNHDLWPHGHQVWKKPEPSHVKYCCKYTRKDVEQGQEQSKFQTSKNPPLGAHYFVGRAVELAQKGLPLRDAFYTFPEAKKKDGTAVQFYLRGATADYYRAAYATAWRLLRGQSEHWPAVQGANDLPQTEFLMEYLDRVARKEREEENTMTHEQIHALVAELVIWKQRADAGLPKYAELLDEYYLRQKAGWGNFTWDSEDE